MLRDAVSRGSTWTPREMMESGICPIGIGREGGRERVISQVNCQWSEDSKSDQNREPHKAVMFSGNTMEASHPVMNGRETTAGDRR